MLTIALHSLISPFDLVLLDCSKLNITRHCQRDTRQTDGSPCLCFGVKVYGCRDYPILKG